MNQSMGDMCVLPKRPRNIYSDLNVKDNSRPVSPNLNGPIHDQPRPICEGEMSKIVQRLTVVCISIL